MRILSGKYKGRILKTPKGKQTRPTTSLVRKALFDIARDAIEEAVVLDLFAGSGAMGIEALSRGASHVTFIEKNRQAAKCIQENLRALKIEKPAAKLLKGDVLTLLKRLAKTRNEYSIITIDPPYDLAPHLLPEILILIDTTSLLATNGILFVEQGAHTTFSLEPLARNSLKQCSLLAADDAQFYQVFCEKCRPLKHLHLSSSRRYGKTHLFCFIQGVSI